MAQQPDRQWPNYVGWSDAKVDALLDQADDEPGRAARPVSAVQAISADELPSLPLYYPVYTYGVSKRVNNVQIGSIDNPSERFTDLPRWYIDWQGVPANQVPPGIPPTPPGG